MSLDLSQVFVRSLAWLIGHRGWAITISGLLVLTVIVVLAFAPTPTPVAPEPAPAPVFESSALPEPPMPDRPPDGPSENQTAAQPGGSGLRGGSISGGSMQ